MVSFIYNVAAASLLGMLAGMGVGGGSLLLLWLTQVALIETTQARIINLLFFLPAAAVSCLFRWKEGTLHWKKVVPAFVSGCAAAFLCSRLADRLQAEYLQKGFGILLLITGIRELRYKEKKR